MDAGGRIVAGVEGEDGKSKMEDLRGVAGASRSEAGRYSTVRMDGRRNLPLYSDTLGVVLCDQVAGAGRVEGPELSIC